MLLKKKCNIYDYTYQTCFVLEVNENFNSKNIEQSIRYFSTNKVIRMNQLNEKEKHTVKIWLFFNIFYFYVILSV